MCLAPFSKQPLEITLSGVTNDPLDLSIDHIRYSSIPVLKRFLGVDEGLELKLIRRGAKPQGFQRPRLLPQRCTLLRMVPLFCRLFPWAWRILDGLRSLGLIRLACRELWHCIARGCRFYRGPRRSLKLSGRRSLEKSHRVFRILLSGSFWKVLKIIEPIIEDESQSAQKLKRPFLHQIFS